MRIIPAIDIIEGKCVRLSKGDYTTKKVYNENPLEVAKQFESFGIQYLHLVDLDGAKAKHITNYNILEEIATKTNLKVDFGGGIKSDTDIKTAFDAGASQVTSGSIAVKEPELFKSWLKSYGKQKIILGADAQIEKVAIHGWQEESHEDLLPFIHKYLKEGVAYVICTDISKDGMLDGPAFDLYQKILNQMQDLKLIASGGVSTLEDLEKLKKIGCEGAIIGKAIYESKIKLEDISKILNT